ncbi:MAG: acyl-CoA dehydrogenase family protein [Acetobacteraceae bacterium]
MSTTDDLRRERIESIRMLRESAAAIAPPGGDLKRIRALRFGSPAYDRRVWQQMCAMGWPGLRVPEDAGGAGLGMAEYCALAEELGAGLTPEPLMACAMAARLLRGASLAALLSGQAVIIPAWQERADTVEPGPDTVFRDGRVSGRKVFLPVAAGIDAFLVTTQAGLALVQADAPGVLLEAVPTQDGGAFGTLTLTEAPGEAVAGDPADAIEEATLATAATLLGIMERSFALTLEFLRTRKQFGRPIGSFQALQHRAADLKLQIALTRASVESAAAVLDSATGLVPRRVAVSRAKARASEAAMLVTRQAIQLHGGIGYTDEYDVGLYLRKAMVLANCFGSAQLHRNRFASLSRDHEDD